MFCLSGVMAKSTGESGAPDKSMEASIVRLEGFMRNNFPETKSCKVCDDSLIDSTFGAFNHVSGGVICKKCFLSGHGGILISQDDFLLLKVGSVGNDGDVRDEPSFVPISRDYGRAKQLQQAKRSNKQSGLSTRTILDGMFEYISGNKLSSLDLLNMVRY